MKFYEKFNLLMNLLNIPNNKLAKALSVDPSLISRWRSGSRDPVKNSTYIDLISQYLVTHANDKQCLYELIRIEPINSHEELVEALSEWLILDHVTDSSFVSNFLSHLTHNTSQQPMAFMSDIIEDKPSGKKLSVEVFHGNEGKRKGVIRFLSAVIMSSKPCELLLYSDESMNWLLEDNYFLAKWGMLLNQVIAKGHCIKIIHTIERHSNELIAAIDRWLPLYLTGSIEPYYYPNYQEALFKRTMFIAPGIGALTSSAIGDVESMEQLYYHDANMIALLQKEFDAYLHLCRPLMRIFTEQNITLFHELLYEFEMQDGDLTYISTSPPLTMLPYDSLCDALNASNLLPDKIEYYKNFYIKRKHAFHEHLKSNNRYDLIHLPESSISIANDEVCSPFAYTFLHEGLTIDKLLFLQQLENVKKILKTNKRYHISLAAHNLPSNILIYFKKEIGVIIYKADNPLIIFAINHPIMVNAFESYIEDLSDNLVKSDYDQHDVIQEINKWINAQNEMH
ncbi:hypothetical protein [Fusibacter bizertensis]